MHCRKRILADEHPEKNKPSRTSILTQIQPKVTDCSGQWIADASPFVTFRLLLGACCGGMSRIEPCTELPVWFRAYSDSALEEFQLADISAANSERKLMDACRGEAQPQRHSEWLVWFRAYMGTSRFSAEEFQLADISSADSKRKLIDACRGQAEVVRTSRLSSRCSILRCAIPWSYKEAMHFCNQHGVTAEEVALTPRSGR